MTRAHIKTAVRLFRCDTAPRHIRRYNARAWLKATHALGSKWILHGGEAHWGNAQRGTK
jgi:hypothetical protein